MILEQLVSARAGISHPNTDLDAQTFLRRLLQIRAEAGETEPLQVAYRPQVSPHELRDPRVLVWDVGRCLEPERGNFDHHQDHELGATPLLLLQALGRQPAPLDRYVDLADRGHFFKEPQPHPYAETLQGLSAGINLLQRRDDERSHQHQLLLAWVEEAGLDPFGRFQPIDLPASFRPFQEAKRAEEAAAEREADRAVWHQTPMGRLAFVETGYSGTMHMLYRRGAALVLLYERRARMPGWQRPAPRFTLGANPAVVAIPQQVDLRPLFARLSQLEPAGRWGGQAGIGGSPRDEGGTALTPHEVMRELLASLG